MAALAELEGEQRKLSGELSQKVMDVMKFLPKGCSGAYTVKIGFRLNTIVEQYRSIESPLLEEALSAMMAWRYAYPAEVKIMEQCYHCQSEDVAKKAEARAAEEAAFPALPKRPTLRPNGGRQINLHNTNV